MNGGVIKIKPEHVEEDRLIPADLRTAKVAKDVANSLFSFIQMEIDCPSMHDSNLVPILDLQVGIQNNIVEFQHYRKPCASFLVTHAKSAMPNRQKMITLVTRGGKNTEKYQ